MLMLIVNQRPSRRTVFATRATCFSMVLAVLCGLFPMVASFQARLPTTDMQPSMSTRSNKNPLQVTASTAAGGTKTSTEPKKTTTTTTSNNKNEKTTKNKMVGKVGNWEELYGNWVLAPPSAALSDEPPRALLHFLGGALVGASPHITYRYMLERLAEKGFLIVATPYQLSFDHLETCDDVITRFENAAPTIARQYGALPVVGIGHSCGALLQLLITCLFPDTPRAANALISFNNKPVTEAVPFFEEVFAPFFTSIATKNGTFPGGNEALALSLQLAKAATEGDLPSDELLQELAQLLTPPGFDSPADSIKIPKELRETATQFISPSVEALSEAGLLPILNQAVISFEQIPKLVDEVANGARDFTPTPSATRAAARKAYRARRTLIMEFSEDSLDESDQIETLLKEAESITRMRRPMINIDVKRVVLEGGHATPLLAPPLDLAERAEDILGAETSKDRLSYQQASSVVDQLIGWLEEGNL